MPRITALKVNYKVKEIGRVIRAYMVLADKTQEEVADEIGITQQALGKKLRTNKFDYEELIRIFAFLGVAPEGIIDLMTV